MLVLCKYQGNGHIQGKPDPEVGVVYKVIGIFTRERCTITSSNKWYTLSWRSEFSFNDTLFEVLPDDFVTNIQPEREPAKIKVKMPVLTETTFLS